MELDQRRTFMPVLRSAFQQILDSRESMASLTMERYDSGHLLVQNEDQALRLESPERGSCGQSPSEGLQGCHEQPLDFSCRSTANAVAAVSDDEDSPMSSRISGGYNMNGHPHPLTPSPTPPEPPSQAFSYPLQDAMKSFGSSTVTNGQSPPVSPAAEEPRYRYDAVAASAAACSMLPGLLRNSSPGLQMNDVPLVSDRLPAYDVTPPLVRPTPQQPAFPSSPEPSSMPTSFPTSTSRTSKTSRPFKLYSQSQHGFPFLNIASQMPYPTSELLRVQPLPENPLYQAFKENFTRSKPVGGRDSNRRSRTASANSNATSTAASPPDNANGSIDSRFDSGDDGDPMSAENSNSSSPAVAKGAAAGSSGSVNGGSVQEDSSTGSTRRRGRVPPDCKDQAYWERRKKNNEAAKRSRDARRAKEDEIAIRAAFYQQENIALKIKVHELLQEVALLRAAMFRRM